MGIILCDRHGTNPIAQMSKRLYGYYINNIKTEIFKVVFIEHHIKPQKKPLYISHYFASDEDLSQYRKNMSAEHFDLILSVIGSNPIACSTCFNSYLEENKVITLEVVVTL